MRDDAVLRRALPLGRGLGRSVGTMEQWKSPLKLLCMYILNRYISLLLVCAFVLLNFKQLCRVAFEGS